MRRGRVAGDGSAQVDRPKSMLSIAGYCPGAGVGPFKSSEFTELDSTSLIPMRHLDPIGQLKIVAANLGKNCGRESCTALLESPSFLANVGIILVGCDIAVQFKVLVRMLHLRPPSMMRTWRTKVY
jgi:hypothetical protein